MSEVQLQFGMRDGKLVHISKLTQNERGDNCNCFCPCCGAPLTARMGQINQWHFAHASRTNCSNISAQQTALHMLAKEIIEEEKELLFPALIVDKKDVLPIIDEKLRQYPVRGFSWEYFPPKTISCLSIQLERHISDIVPDIIIEVGSEKYLLEIAVTHFVDEEKKKKIKKIGLPLFEIDLSNFHKSNFNQHQLRNEILTNSKNRRWVYHPCFEEAKAKKATEYSIEAQRMAKEQQVTIKERKAQEQSQRLKKKSTEKKQGFEEIKNLNFDSRLPIQDQFGYRWFQCTECKNIRHADDMLYKDFPMTNKGYCKACQRKNYPLSK